MKENEANYNSSPAAKEKKTKQSYLNPSLYHHLQSTLSYSSPNIRSHGSQSRHSRIPSRNHPRAPQRRRHVTKARDEAGDMEVLHATMDIARYSAASSSKESALKAYDTVHSPFPNSASERRSTPTSKWRESLFSRTIIKNEGGARRGRRGHCERRGLGHKLPTPSTIVITKPTSTPSWTSNPTSLPTVTCNLMSDTSFATREHGQEFRSRNRVFERAVESLYCHRTIDCQD